MKLRLGAMKSSLSPQITNNISPRTNMRNEPHPKSGKRRSSPVEPGIGIDISNLRHYESRERSPDRMGADQASNRKRLKVERLDEQQLDHMEHVKCESLIEHFFDFLSL